MEPLLRHKEESPTCSFMRQRSQAVKGERGKTKSVVAPSKPLNSRLTSSIGQSQSSSLVTSKSIHTVVTGLNEPRLFYGGSFDETGKSKSLVAPSKPTNLNELPLPCESNIDGGPVAEIVVGNGHRWQDPDFSKMDAINLPIQAEEDEFSTGPISPSSQPLTEVMVVPLPHFMNVTQPGGILPFLDWPTVDHSDRFFSSEVLSEDRGAIYPPNFDASVSLLQSPSSDDTIPVQSSEANEYSAVIISALVPMKTIIAGCHPLADLYKVSFNQSTVISAVIVSLQSPKTINILFKLLKVRLDDQCLYYFNTLPQ